MGLIRKEVKELKIPMIVTVDATCDKCDKKVFNDELGILDRAVTITMAAGYGSEFDRFDPVYYVICDDCWKEFMAQFPDSLCDDNSK